MKILVGTDSICFYYFDSLLPYRKQNMQPLKKQPVQGKRIAGDRQDGAFNCCYFFYLYPFFGEYAAMCNQDAVGCYTIPG